MCTEIYGGPQRARIRGRIGSRSIDRRFARRDGCEIADWDRAQALLPRVRDGDGGRAATVAASAPPPYDLDGDGRQELVIGLPWWHDPDKTSQPEPGDDMRVQL